MGNITASRLIVSAKDYLMPLFIERYKFLGKFNF